jgi:hypothetical protein
MTTTVQNMIEQARVRHPSFMPLNYPDGAILMFLNQYQRTALLKFADSIEPLIGQARQIATVIAGALVGSDAGVPYYITTSGDGWPVQSDLGVPYIDYTQPAIALDPFGLTGSTPGFPLPADFIKMINVVAASLYDAALPVEIMPENQRRHSPQRTLSVFISGNRLVPIRLGAAPFNDRWQDVTSVTLSYIAMQTLTAASDVLTLPSALLDAMESAVAERYALAAPKEAISDALKLQFVKQRVASEAAMLEAGMKMLGDVTTSHVQFMG